MNDRSLTKPLSPGTRLREYIIREELGRGGIGIVYAAHHEMLDETFAIKEFLPYEIAHRDVGDRVRPLPGREKKYGEFRNKFLEEGKTLVQLSKPRPHPNLVQVSHAFRENDTVYLCMRFERGEPLDRMLARRGPLGEEELRAIVKPLLDGLEHAHAHRVWHRDIKPANILIRDDGSPVLVDFGAARVVQADPKVSVIAQLTPRYAAPEQIFGGDQGPWTDIYAMGATLFYVVTGEAPAQGAVPPDWRIAHDRYSDSFLAAIDAALRFDSARRPQDVAAWRALFGGLDEGVQNESAIPTLALSGPLPDADAHAASAANTAATMHRAKGAHNRRRPVYKTVGISLLAVVSAVAVIAGAWLYGTSRQDPAGGSTQGPHSAAGGTGQSAGVAPTEAERIGHAPEGADRVSSGGTEVAAPRSRILPVTARDDATPRTEERAEETEAGPRIGETGGSAQPAAPVRGEREVLQDVERILAGADCARLAVRLSPPPAVDRFATAQAHPEYPGGGYIVDLFGFARDRPAIMALRERLLALASVERVDSDEVERASPFCRIVTVMNAAVNGALRPATAPTIVLNRPDRIYREEDFLALTIVNRNAEGGYLYLDLIDRNEEVVHLLPSPSAPNNFVGAEASVRIGVETPEQCELQLDNCFIVSKPHGNNMILGVWSATPLFRRPRPSQAEALDPYLSALAAALADSRTAPGAHRAVAYRFFETRR